MEARNNGAEPVNSYALVAYIPGELGRFLDELRRELVPGCSPRAHVTILPPRPLAGTTESARNKLETQLPDFPAFEVEPTTVEVFTSTGVIYVTLGAGRYELGCMHERLNTGPLKYAEPFAYHPHITLAQELELPDVRESLEFARRRWAEYSGIRMFAVDTIIFVQNTTRDCWVDLAQWTLGGCLTGLVAEDLLK